MSSPSTRNSVLFYCFSVVFTIAILVPQAVFAGEGARLIPRSAMAYGHFKVAELVKANPSNLFKRLYGHVEKELSTFSVQKLGVDIATLSEVTVVVPDFQTANAMGNDAPPFVVAATWVRRCDAWAKVQP